MTHTELKELQQRIKFDAPSTSKCLGIPYDTYRNYIYGANVIPPQVERAALELEQIQKQFDIERDREYCQFLDQKFPHGILSEIGP